MSGERLDSETPPIEDLLGDVEEDRRLVEPPPASPHRVESKFPFPSFLARKMSDTFPDPALVIARTFELLGGREIAWKAINEDFGAMTRRWNQDIVTTGRILRSHLFVEHYLTEYLEKRNPNIGPLAGVRLTFSQKVALMDEGNPSISEILPGIRHLNKIRNRLAHNLAAGVNDDDAGIFLQAELFSAMRKAGAKPDIPSPDPLDVLEKFAQYASSLLHGEFGAFADAFGRALKECSPKSEM